MKIGLIVATFNELNSLLNNLNLVLNKLSDEPFEVYYLKINNNDIYIAKSGIGEISSASLTQFLITKYEVKLIINAGVVGALKKDLKIKELCIVKDVVHYDFDISKIDDVKVGEYEGIGIHIPLNKEYIKLLTSKYKNLNVVSCASGDKFIEEPNFINYLVTNFDTDICDMELAGITLVALKNKVNVISIKAISDSGDSESYNKNVTEACNILYSLISDITTVIK